MIRLITVCSVVASLSGCAWLMPQTDWVQVSALVDKEYAAVAAWSETVKAIAAPADNNMTSEGEIAHEMRMAFLQRDIAALKPDTLNTVLNYDYRRAELGFRVFDTLWNGSLTALLVCEIPLDCNKQGTSNGMLFDVSGSGHEFNVTAASDSSSIVREGSTAGTHQGVVAQDGSSVQSGQSQRQEGDGQLLGLGTDPLQFPNFQNQGGAGGAGSDSPGAPGGGGPNVDTSTGITPTIGTQ